MIEIPTRRTMNLNCQLLQRLPDLCRDVKPHPDEIKELPFMFRDLLVQTFKFADLRFTHRLLCSPVLRNSKTKSILTPFTSLAWKSSRPYNMTLWDSPCKRWWPCVCLSSKEILAESATWVPQDNIVVLREWSVMFPPNSCCTDFHGSLEHHLRSFNALAYDIGWRGCSKPKESIAGKKSGHGIERSVDWCMYPDASSASTHLKAQLCSAVLRKPWQWNPNGCPDEDVFVRQHVPRTVL